MIRLGSAVVVIVSAGKPGLKWSCMCDCSECAKPPLHWLRAKCATIEPLEIVKSLADQVIVFDRNNYLVLLHILIRPLSSIDKELQLTPNPVIPTITTAGQDTSTVACRVSESPSRNDNEINGVPGSY